MSDINPQPKAWHTLTIDSATEHLDANQTDGLSSPEVDQRLQKYGSNVMAETKVEPLWL